MVLSIEKLKPCRVTGGVSGGALILLLFVAACTEPQPPEEFREAFTALDRALTKERLEASSFAPRFPSPSPKQVVSYLLSQAGSEVLQISTSPFREDVVVMSDVPVWPSSITLWHTKRQPYGKQKQVILSWDDPAMIVRGSAYIANVAEPVYVREWTVSSLTSTRQSDSSDTREFQAF